MVEGTSTRPTNSFSNVLHFASMSRAPPRYSQRHFNWGEPVASDGSIPLDYVMAWLKNNLIDFRQAADKDKVLTPLCQDLNQRGIKCTVTNIIVEFECLTRTAWRNRKSVTQDMYNQDLFEHYFDEQEADLVHRHRESHMHERNNAISQTEEQPTESTRSQCLRWLEASSAGGPCPMDMLVSWLPNNFKAYRKADKARRRGLLKPLCDKMKCAGHSACSEMRIAAKIHEIFNEFKLELQGDHNRKEFFRLYRDFFMNLFGYVRENANDQNLPRWSRRQRSHSRESTHSSALDNSGVSDHDVTQAVENNSDHVDMHDNDGDINTSLDVEEVTHRTNENGTQQPTENKQVHPTAGVGRRLFSLEELARRTEVVLGRKKLQDANIPDVVVDFFLPKPEACPTDTYRFGLEGIEIRTQVGLHRKTLEDQGIVAAEIEALLPLPTLGQEVNKDGEGKSAAYPFRLEEIKVLTQLGTARQFLRTSGGSEGDIEESLPLPA